MLGLEFVSPPKCQSHTSPGSRKRLGDGQHLSLGTEAAPFLVGRTCGAIKHSEESPRRGENSQASPGALCRPSCSSLGRRRRAQSSLPDASLWAGMLQLKHSLALLIYSPPTPKKAIRFVCLLSQSPDDSSYSPSSFPGACRPTV